MMSLRFGVGVCQDRVYAILTYPIQGGALTIVHWEMLNILIALRLLGKYCGPGGHYS